MAEQATTDEELPVIARFEVRRRSYLAPEGTVQRRLPHFASDTSALLSLYRGMVLTRAFDTDVGFGSRNAARGSPFLGVRTYANAFI